MVFLKAVWCVENGKLNTLAYGREKKNNKTNATKWIQINRLKYLLLICMECFVVFDINGKPVPMPNTWQSMNEGEIKEYGGTTNTEFYVLHLWL